MKKKMRLIISIICLVPFILSGNVATAQMTTASAPDTDIRISMDFESASLNDVLKIFSQQSGLNFIAADEIRSKMVTMYLDNVSVQDALNSIINANNLRYEQPAGSNIFIVRDLGISPIKLMTKVYYFKHARVSSSRLTQEIEEKIGGGGAGGTSSGSSGSSGSATGGSEEDTGADPAAMVKKVLSKNGSVVEDARTNSLIITDVPAQFDLIEQTISAIDVPVPQVLIEVEMLDVSKELLDKLGIKYPQAFLQYGGTLNSLKLNTDWPIPAKEAIRLGGTGTAIAQAAQFSIMGGGITVEMLTTDTRTRYLARPRILTLSNETAEIEITSDEAIGATQSTSGTATTVTTGSAERQTTGIVLRVTPQVDKDEGLITLFVQPTVSKTGSSVTFQAGGQNNTYVNPETRQTKSVVRLKDGETIVLGGLIRTDKKVTYTKVPFLGDIPILGKFFTHKDDTKNEDRELIVFLTPHIIKEASTPQVAQQREQTLPTSSDYTQEQTIVPDRKQSVSEALEQASVQLAMPK